MATVYEFRYVDATGGSTPSSPAPGGPQPSAPQTEPPKIPEPSPPPQAPGVSGTDQIDKIVDRAGKQQPPQAAVPPSQRPVDPAPPQLPTAPAPPASAQAAPAGITAEQMERLIDRVGREGDREGQAPAQATTPGTPAPPQPPTPPSTPAPPTPPPQPPMPPQATPPINLGGIVGQQLPPGQRPLPEHPDLPPLEPPKTVPQPQAPPQPQQPPQAPAPPAATSGLPGSQAAMRQQIQQLLSGMAGMSGIPGAGALAGMATAAAPAAGALGAAGFIAAMMNVHRQDMDRMTQFSPELARAKAQGDVAETQRLMDQARRYGEADARSRDIWNRLGRAATSVGAQIGREFDPFSEPPPTAPDPFNFGIGSIMRIVEEGIRELRRANASAPSPLELMIGDYDWLPTPYDGGQTTQDTRDPRVPITGF